MKINDKDILTFVPAFANDAFLIGKAYNIKFNDEDVCAEILTGLNKGLSLELSSRLQYELTRNGIDCLFENFYNNNNIAEFIVVLPDMACEACTLKIPAKICDDSAEIAAGVVSPVEIIAYEKMEE